jgi:hypothetical protein
MNDTDRLNYVLYKLRVGTSDMRMLVHSWGSNDLECRGGIESAMWQDIHAQTKLVDELRQLSKEETP